MSDSIITLESIKTPDGYEPKLLKVLTYPNDILHTKSEPVAQERFGTDDFNQLIYDMFYTMRVKNGVGIAAIQVGVPEQLLVLMLEAPLVIVNPTIVAKEGEFKFEEGCLSTPGYFENRTRANKIRVAYQDEEGTPKELVAEGLTAFCIQHEFDHLNGKLFIDELSTLKKMRVKQKINKTLKHTL